MIHGHVAFESLLERDWLMWADYRAAELVAFSSQPLALLWPRGTQGSKSHVPDFFARRVERDGLLVDVCAPVALEKPARQRQMNLTRAACDEVGWGYEVFTGLEAEGFSLTRATNLRWLAGFRHDRYALPASDEQAVVDVFRGGVPLDVGIIRAAKATGWNKTVAHAGILNLLWRQRLCADLDAPLSMRTEVTA